MHADLLHYIYAICAPLSFECGAHILKNLRNALRQQRVLCSHADDETEKKKTHFTLVNALTMPADTDSPNLTWHERRAAAYIKPYLRVGSVR